MKIYSLQGKNQEGKNTKGTSSLILSLCVLGLTLSFALNGHAGRFLAVAKDQASYLQAQNLLTMNSLSGAQNDSQLAFVGKIDGLTNQSDITLQSNEPVKLLKSLDQIQTFVIESSNQASVDKLMKTGKFAFIEAERFFPAPRPVKGNLAKEAFKGIRLFSDEANFKEGSNTPWGIIAVKAIQSWEKSKKGKGARVLVLDTGIDRDHPALKDNLEKAKNFVGANTGPYDYFDQVGHGSHVAGTIAAKQFENGFTGVAPEAKILAGRVCDSRSCSTVAVAEGINWGVAEKVDVINMSLGGVFGSNGQKLAVEAAEAAGVSVVAASGNDGQEYVNYPAAFPSVIAVGAVDSKLLKANFSNWGSELAIAAPGVEVNSAVPMGKGRESHVAVSINGSGTKKINANSFVGSAEVPAGIESDMIDCGLGKPTDFTDSVKGKFALISRGEISFADKAKNAETAGAAGVMIYNNAPGLVGGTLGDKKVNFPVVMIEQGVGNEIKQALLSKQTASGLIKTVATDYSGMSGTSMASPHVAGVVALIRATNKSLTPAQVKELIKTSAQALPTNKNNELGAGLVDAEKAVQTAAGL